MQPPTRHPPPRPSPVRIAALYAVIGWLWVLFSDRLLAGFAPNLETLIRLQAYNSWFFVFVTAALLSWSIRRYASKPGMHTNDGLSRSFSDIAERRRAEEALQQSELKFRTVFQASVDAIGVSKAGVHVFVNPAYVKLFGYANEGELAGKPTIDLIAPDQREAILEYVRRRLAGEPAPSFYETKGRKNDGTEFSMEVHRSGYEQGGELHTLVILRDITERKKAEDELRRVSTEWRAAMDASEDIIYLLGLDRRLMRANKAFFTMTNSTPETAMGRHIVELVHPQGEVEPCPVCRAQAEKRDLVFIMEADHPDNPANRPIEISCRIVRDEQDQPVSILMVLHDLSHDRKILEELKKYQEHLEELVKRRTAELEAKIAEIERMNRLFVDRELRMVELKERIMELEDKNKG